jgi:hypothetical protein
LAWRAGQETADALGGEDERPPKPSDGKEYYWHPTLGWTPEELGRPKTEHSGGVLPTAQAEGASAKETNQRLEDEYSKTYTAGQIAGAVPSAPALVTKSAGKVVGKVFTGTGKAIEGAGKGLEKLAPWSASDALFNEVASGGKNLLARAGVKSAAAPVTTGAVAARGRRRHPSSPGGRQRRRQLRPDGRHPDDRP